MKEEMMYMPKEVTDAFMINPDDFEKFKAIKPALAAHGVDIICDSIVEPGKFIATGRKASEFAKMIRGMWDTKAAFEKWWKEDSGQADICAGSNIGSTIKMIAFDAWQTSREAIEIELPDPDMWGDEQSLQAIGIRIKGKTE